MSRRIYLASSWRNEQQPKLVQMLRQDGHEVYDFRNPKPGDQGFSWKQVNEDTELRSGDVQPSDIEAYLRALKHPRALEGFESDWGGMVWADTFVLLLPCGRSAHLEAGWAAGAGKECHVVLSTDRFEPELMYLLCADIHASIGSARTALLRGRHG